MTHLYLMRDAAGEPIYVGISDNLPLRLRVHRSQSPWFHEVAEIESYPCDSRADAEELEVCAAAAYRPRHNVNLVPGRRRERGSRVARRAA